MVAIASLRSASSVLFAAASGEMNVQVSAADFKVLDNQFGNLEIETDLRVTGDAAKPHISGEIRTETGRVEVDRLLEQLTRSPYRTEATVATTTETEATATVADWPVSGRHRVSTMPPPSMCAWCCQTIWFFAVATCTRASRESASAT